MANILGSLIFHLGADTSTLKMDLGKANHIAQRESAKMAAAFKVAGAALAVGVTVAAVKMEHLVQAQFNVQDATAKLSRQVGIATEKLAGYQLAAQQSGVGAEMFSGALIRLARNASDAATGLSTQQRAFKAIGVEVLDAHGKLKPMSDLLSETAEKFSEYEDSAQKTALATMLFGRAGAALIPMLNSGKKGLEDYLKTAEALGLTIEGPASKAAERYNDAMEKLGLVSKGVANQIATKLAPALADLAEKAVAFFTSAKWRQTLDSIARGAQAVADNFDKIIGAVKLCGQVVVAWIGVKAVTAVLRYATAMLAATVATDGATVAAARWGAMTAASFTKSIKAIGVLGVAGNLLIAGFAGWKLGTYFRENFLVARLAGIAFVDGMLKGWAILKASSESMWAAIQIAGTRVINALKTAMASMVGGVADLIQKLPESLGGGGELGKKLRGVSDALTKSVGDSETFVQARDRIANALKSEMAAITVNTSGMADYEIAQNNAKNAIKATADESENAGKELKELGPILDDTASKTKDAAEQLDKYAELLGAMSGRIRGYQDDIDGLTRMQVTYREEVLKLVELFSSNAIDPGQLAAGVALATNELGAALAASDDGLQNLRHAGEDAEEQLRTLTARMTGASDAQIKFNEAQRAAALALKNAGGAMNTRALEVYIKKLAQAKENLITELDLSKAFRLDDLLAEFNQQSPFDHLIDAAASFKEALEDATDPAIIARLQAALDSVNGKMRATFIDSTAQALQGVQSLTKEGSKEFAVLGLALQALATVKAVNAILTQGEGDPYSAWARMAAMAAAVAPLLASVGAAAAAFGGGSGSRNSAASRQATQSTGTVLGDASAKSESIAKATEITASATEKLVGINRGMLNALTSLQHALSAAGVLLARGAGDAKFPNIGGSSGFLSTIFGGKKKVTDEGIIISGGQLTDLMNNAVVTAFQTVQTSGGWFHRDKTKDNTSDVSSAFADQFNLAITSIVDTVKEASLALGLMPEDIQAAIDSFQVAEMRISLEGLSAEDQQRELEAAFSAIFDGLAGAVVPFIGQFQQVGEGLGETLVRVATEVQVFQQAVRYLGLAVDEADPEKFAQISDGLIQMVGGVDAFVQAMGSFVSAFAPEGFQQQLRFEDLTTAFAAVGLELPATSEGVWELMNSLDASTEAGRAQIATLLRLTDTAKEYYKQLESVSKDAYQTMIADIQGELGMNPLASSLIKIGQWSIDTAKKLDEAAKAAGRVGISEKDLSLIREVALKRMQAAIADLMDQSADLVSRLYGANGATDAVTNFGNAISATADRARNAIDLMLGDLSPFSDRKKLEIALEGQKAGTVTPEQVLQIGRRLFASGADYRELFNQVMSVGDRTQQGRDSANFAHTASATMQTAAHTLTKAERYGLADQLANNIADLSYATGQSFAEVADKLGLNLADLGRDLGLDGTALDDYLRVLDSDNFGLDDLSDVLRIQIDRLIEAITGVPVMDSRGVDSVIPGLAPLGGVPRVLPPRGDTPGRFPGARGDGGAGNRSMTDDDAERVGRAIGREIASALREGGAAANRSSRVPQHVR